MFYGGRVRYEVFMATLYMGVEPKDRGILPPKWMVKIMENPIKMDDLVGFPIIFGNTPQKWEFVSNNAEAG